MFGTDTKRAYLNGEISAGEFYDRTRHLRRAYVIAGLIIPVAIVVMAYKALF